MTDRDQKYLERLTRWLKFYGTSGPQIIAILSEVTAHLVDSGEDPNEAFGTPQTYAHQFSQRSQLSWTRRTSGVVALGTAVACCLFIAEAIAHADTQRPAPWSMPQWMVVLAAILSAVLSWRSSLYVFSPPLSAVAEEGVDVALAWKRRVRLRVMVSLILLIMVVAVSSLWGISLGHAYLQVPKLRTANFVDSSIQPGDTSTTMVVRTVLYLDAPGPYTNLQSADLSTSTGANIQESDSLQGYDTLAQALQIVRQKNWGFNAPDDVNGYQVNTGHYYVLTWVATFHNTFNPAPPVQENLVITYYVSGDGVEELSIPLSFNSDGSTA